MIYRRTRLTKSCLFIIAAQPSGDRYRASSGNIGAMSTEHQFGESDKLPPKQGDAVRGESTAHFLLRRPGAVVLTVTLIAIIAFSVVLSSRHHPPRESNAIRLTLGLPRGITLHRNWHPFEYIALSPDGEMLAFAATDGSGQSSLWIRPLSSPEARKMDQTERSRCGNGSGTARSCQRRLHDRSQTFLVVAKICRKDEGIKS